MASDQAHQWFSKAVGEPVRLVHADDPSRRRANPARTQAVVPMAFADGYPLHLATEESLADLNAQIAAGPMADQGPLPMVRFRPNIVVAGAEPWADDGWHRIRIGEGVYRAVKGCARCTIPTTDHETAEHFKEPTATMARTRRWDGQVWFGTNLVCDTPGVTIRVGDEVEVLETRDGSDGPPSASDYRCRGSGQAEQPVAADPDRHHGRAAPDRTACRGPRADAWSRPPDSFDSWVTAA